MFSRRTGTFFRQISEKVKISVPTVSNKINNLEKLGVVRGYRAELDPERLGELSVVLIVKSKPSDLNKIAERLDSNENVRQMFFLSNGTLFLMCTFTAAHLINDFVSRLSQNPEITEYSIANIVRVGKEEERAIIEPGLGVVIECSQCGKEVREEPVKLKEEGKDYYSLFTLMCHRFPGKTLIDLSAL